MNNSCHLASVRLAAVNSLRASFNIIEYSELLDIRPFIWLIIHMTSRGINNSSLVDFVISYQMLAVVQTQFSISLPRVARSAIH